MSSLSTIEELRKQIRHIIGYCAAVKDGCPHNGTGDNAEDELVIEQIIAIILQPSAAAYQLGSKAAEPEHNPRC